MIHRIEVGYKPGVTVDARGRTVARSVRRGPGPESGRGADVAVYTTNAGLSPAELDRLGNELFATR